MVADCRRPGVAPNRSWWAEAPWGCAFAAVVGVARRGCHLHAVGAVGACHEREGEEEDHQRRPGTYLGVAAV